MTGERFYFVRFVADRLLADSAHYVHVVDEFSALPHTLVLRLGVPETVVEPLHTRPTLHLLHLRRK